MRFNIGHELKDIDNLQEIQKAVSDVGTDLGPLTISIGQQINSIEELQDINPILQKAVANLGRDVADMFEFTLVIKF